jgi:Asp/Glu/hydantoin racemase
MDQKSVEMDGYKFSVVTLLEEKRVMLENKLSKNLQKKHALELKINNQFEKIKVVEVEIEKMNASNEQRPRRMHQKGLNR